MSKVFSLERLLTLSFISVLVLPFIRDRVKCDELEVVSLLLILIETYIPNHSLLLSLEQLEKVSGGGGWWWVLESHFSVQLKPKPS